MMRLTWRTGHSLKRSLGIETTGSVAARRLRWLPMAIGGWDICFFDHLQLHVSSYWLVGRLSAGLSAAVQMEMVSNFFNLRSLIMPGEMCRLVRVSEISTNIHFAASASIKLIMRCVYIAHI